MSFLKGWRTVLTNAVVVICGVLAYLQTAGLEQFLPPKYAWIVIVIGATNIGLRLITNTAVGQKDA